jgi:hypothetical protein
MEPGEFDPKRRGDIDNAFACFKHKIPLSLSLPQLIAKSNFHFR